MNKSRTYIHHMYSICYVWLGLAMGWAWGWKKQIGTVGGGPVVGTTSAAGSF